MKTTRYIGKVIDDRIFLICEDSDGNKIQVPHIDLMREQGLDAVAYHGATPKEPYKFLTTLELARFLQGKDIKGNTLVTPAEQRKAHQKSLEESLKDPEFASLYQEVMKLRGAK